MSGLTEDGDVGPAAAWPFAVGWAVIDHQRRGIDVRTVSDTRRAAIVNWLVAEAGCMMISNAYSDDQIEKLWAYYRGRACVEEVSIERNAPTPESDASVP